MDEERGQSQQTPKMKVLVLGMSRTGTQSIVSALEQLGIAPSYHMREVGKNNHHSLWIDAMRSGATLTQKDFDRMLAGYEAVADYPATFFAPSLVAAYPDAKLILSVRPEDSWMRSMTQTLIHAHQYADNPKTSARQLSEEYHSRAWNNDFAANGRQAFRSHNDAVRMAARREGRELLEYDVSQGWKPLCEFLNVDVPTTDFPREDAWKTYKEHHFNN